MGSRVHYMSSCGSEDTLGWRCKILVRQKHEILIGRTADTAWSCLKGEPYVSCRLEAAQAMWADDALQTQMLDIQGWYLLCCILVLFWVNVLFCSHFLRFMYKCVCMHVCGDWGFVHLNAVPIKTRRQRWISLERELQAAVSSRCGC